MFLSICLACLIDPRMHSSHDTDPRDARIRAEANTFGPRAILPFRSPSMLPQPHQTQRVKVAVTDLPAYFRHRVSTRQLDEIADALERHKLIDSKHRGHIISHIMQLRDRRAPFDNKDKWNSYDYANNVFEWWDLWLEERPLLTRDCKLALSLPPITGEAERNWSEFGNTYTTKSNRIDNRRVEKLVFIHHNLRSGKSFKKDAYENEAIEARLDAEEALKQMEEVEEELDEEIGENIIVESRPVLPDHYNPPDETRWDGKAAMGASNDAGPSRQPSSWLPTQDSGVELFSDRTDPLSK